MKWLTDSIWIPPIWRHLFEFVNFFRIYSGAHSAKVSLLLLNNFEHILSSWSFWQLKIWNWFQSSVCGGSFIIIEGTKSYKTNYIILNKFIFTIIIKGTFHFTIIATTRIVKLHHFIFYGTFPCELLQNRAGKITCHTQNNCRVFPFK